MLGNRTGLMKEQQQLLQRQRCCEVHAETLDHFRQSQASTPLAATAAPCVLNAMNTTAYLQTASRLLTSVSSVLRILSLSPRAGIVHWRRQTTASGANFVTRRVVFGDSGRVNA
ncbi:hypothetical protein MRX96_041581 [Rhipicephalus microplus]